MAALSGSLDANVVLRLLLNDIPEQHKAVAKLIQNTNNQFAISDTAIIEVVFVLERYYNFTRPQIAEAIEGLMLLTAINCNRALFNKAILIFIKNTKLSFEDCCLAVYAKLNNALPLYTFDKKLANQVEHCKLLI